MKKLATIQSPGKMTVLAALLAGLAGSATAASPNLVISQIYGAGGNSGTTFFTHDYIEIFNRGATAVTATGWTVQYGSASSTGDWSGKSVLPTFTIQPGQYILIQEQSGGTGQPALPTPVITPVSGAFNMSGTTGKVALVNNNVVLNGASPATANIVDMIGFGTANGAEGTRAVAMSNTLALFRAAGGCTDTDMNSADFATGAPAPRTSASPLNSCGNSNPQPQPIVTSCPATLSVDGGTAAFATLSATDADSELSGAIITSAAVPGLTLGSFLRSPDGKSATIDLLASASLAGGIYPTVIKFTNADAQEASCTVNVAVAGQASIMQIQGAGATSPYNNTVQTTSGVVTHKVSNGYFLQDQNGDGDPSTSDALFIFTSTAPTVTVGDIVEVKGTITEYRPTGAPRTYTEMKDLLATRLLGSGASITPTNINFAGAAELPRYEAMLVSISNSLTVNQTSYLGDRGELTLANGRRETPTNRYRPNSAGALAMASANLDNVLILDDSLFVTPTTIPYIGQDGTVRAGDTVSNLVGVLDYGSIGGGGAAFKIQPTVAPVFSRTNARLAAPSLPNAEVRVASANVLNFFTTFLNGADAWGNTGQGCTVGSTTRASNCRGADNMPEFIVQRDKIVSELVAMNADVVGLMEIQNNGDIAVDYLVQQLNGRVGQPVYAYVPRPAALGTDAIRVAMIYKPAKVSLVGGALSDGDSVNNRPPMAQTFKALNGAKFSVVVNHLKSKAGCGSGGDADLNDGQSCNNATRVEQAARLRDYFLPLVTSTAGDPDVLVIGDMNAHGFEDPIHLLNQAGLVNQLERFVRPNEIPYSYVFDGEVGYLDHALASASLSAQITGATEWHTNADEPTVIDYNLDGKSPAAQALITSDAFRSSDHDPVVVALGLTPTYLDISATFTVARSGLTLNRATGKYTGTITLTNNAASAISGPFHVKFAGLPAGVSLDFANGTHAGAPYLTVNSGPVAPGGKLTLQVQFHNPAKVGISYNTFIYSGNF